MAPIACKEGVFRTDLFCKCELWQFRTDHVQLLNVFLYRVFLAPNKSDTDVKWESALMGNLHNNKDNGTVDQSWILLSVKFNRDLTRPCGIIGLSPGSLMPDRHNARLYLRESVLVCREAACLNFAWRYCKTMWKHCEHVCYLIKKVQSIGNGLENHHQPLPLVHTTY